MRTVKITKEQSGYFAGVAPSEILGLLSLPNGAGIGVVTEDEVVGAAIITGQGNESITIEWLYVDEDHRGKGYGVKLMEEVYATAKKLGVKSIRARMTMDEDFDAKQLYLLQWGFGWRDTLPGEWDVTMKDLFLQPFAKKAATSKEKIPDVKTLAEVEKRDLSEAVKRAAKEGKPMLYNVEADRRFLDPKLSVVSYSKDKINGMLLIHRCENVLYPVLFWAEKNDPRIISRLFGAMFQGGVTSVKAGDVVRITAGSDLTYDYIERLMPDIPGARVYVMQADTDAIDRLKDRDNDETYVVKDLFKPEEIPFGEFEVESFEVR